jgi:hypothetical protein
MKFGVFPYYVAPPPILIFDSFTDTDNVSLNSHTGDLNATWVIGTNQNSGAEGKIFSNRLTKDSSSLTALYYTGTAPNNNCYVQAKIRMLSLLAINCGLLIRLNPASDNYFWVRHNSNQWQLRSTTSGGGAVTLDGGTAVYNDTMAAGDERLVRLEAEGTSLRVYIDGVLRITSTSSDHTSGRAGVRMAGAASSTTGYAVDDFTVGNL